MRILSCFLPAIGLLVVVLASCTSPAVEPAAKERDASSLDAVFSPMQSELSVLCDQLAVDLSRELWDRCGYPSNQAFHRLERRPGPPALYAFRNESGLSMPMKFTIGRQTWLVTQSATFRLHGSGAARFDLVASGNVVVSRAGRPPESAPDLRVEAGRWAGPLR